MRVTPILSGLGAVGLVILAAFPAACQPAAAQPAAARPADCPAPAYSAKIAEAAVTGRAEVQAKIAAALADSAKAQLGDKPSVKGKIDARYVVSAAGGLAKDAYSDTAQSYFCFLRKAAAADPAKVVVIRQQERAFRNTLNKYFDPDVWQIGAIALRNKIGDDIIAETSKPPLLDQGFVAAAIPEYQFDTVKLWQISADWSYSQGNSAGVCAGLVKRSIKRVQPNILDSLQKVRKTVIDWMSGDRVDAEQDLWDYASSQMTQQLIVRAEEQIDIKPELIACLETERNAALQTASAGVAAASQSTATPAASGAAGVPGNSGNGPAAATPKPAPAPPSKQ